LSAMNAPAPAGSLYLVVGYDGSPPGDRALDAAVRLIRGRTGRIEVVYVAHLPSIDMMSPGAVAEMEVSFDEIARDLHTAADEQLRGREERWGFERRQGLIPDELMAAVAAVSDGRELVACDAPRDRLGRRQPGPPLTGTRRGRALELTPTSSPLSGLVVTA